VQRASSSGSVAKFVYDGADVMRDLDGNGNTIADYRNGPRIDNKLQKTASGAGSYFVTDHLGTTRGPAAGAKCHASAAQRYAACLAGLPLPPLDTLNN
jgi:hypothetical protein